jgi:hypothetical protein
LPPIAFSGYRRRFEEPKLEEGFTDIVRVDFEVSFPVPSLTLLEVMLIVL